MADRSISELVAANSIGPSDLFVLEQANTAKKLPGQLLENWLVALADGHGGIQSIAKTSTSGLQDTYTITLSDLTTLTFTVTNGKGVSSITTYYAVSADGSTVPNAWETTRQSMTAVNRYLWSYQHIAFNDSTSIDTVKTVIGVWGDKGETGATGRGIASLVQTSRVPGSYTLYTFTMSDGTTETFYSYDGVGISNIAKTSTVGLVDTYTISYTNNTTSTFTVTNAKSIVSVTKTGTSGLEDTYTVSFNDGTTSTFIVKNGVGISGIEKTSTSGLVDTYTVSLTDGTNATFSVTNAKSIVSVTQIAGTHAAGTSDTYRILFNDGDTVDFAVYNGANGTGSVSSVDGIPSTNQDVGLLTIGNGAPTSSTVGNYKSRYFDASNGLLYICVGVDTSGSEATYSWVSAGGVVIDSALSTTSTNPVRNSIITSAIYTIVNKIGGGSLLVSDTLIGAINSVYLSKASRGVIASGYSSSSTYAVGYCVMRSNAPDVYSMYRCIVPIETPEEWTAAHWQLVTVADELAKKYEKPSGGIPDTDIASAAAWNAKGTYSKPSGGIPSSDMSQAVQTSLCLADTALQSVPNTYRTSAAQDVIDAGKQSAITKKSVSLSTSWSGNGPYTQAVTISGYTITANSKIDLQQNATVISQLVADEVQGLYVENNNGVLTAVAVGAAPTVALTVQCTITEVQQ